MTGDQILQDFPDLTRDDLRACLAFAADRERRLAGMMMRNRAEVIKEFLRDDQKAFLGLS